MAKNKIKIKLTQMSQISLRSSCFYISTRKIKEARIVILLICLLLKIQEGSIDE